MWEDCDCEDSKTQLENCLCQLSGSNTKACLPASVSAGWCCQILTFFFSFFLISLEAHLCPKGQKSLRGSLHARHIASALWLGWGAFSSVSVTLWFEAGHHAHPSSPSLVAQLWWQCPGVTPRHHVCHLGAASPCQTTCGGFLRWTRVGLEGANCCQETFPCGFPVDIVKAGRGEQAGVTVGCAVRKGRLSKARFVKMCLF